MRKEDCNMIPLRLFMGVQMVAYGLLTYFAEPWHLSVILTEKSGWIWSALIAFGGLWMASSALIDLYLANVWQGFGKAKYRTAAVWLAKERLLGFYFSGAVWAGLGYNTLVEGQVHASDFMAPSFVVFLFFLAFKDACRKRKRAVNKHEARKTATALSDGATPDSGIRA